MSDFNSLSPFFSSSILELASKHAYNQMNIVCLAALIVFIMTSEGLVQNPSSPAFVSSFNEDSDIITLLPHIFKLNQPSKKMSEEAENIGFDPREAARIISAMNSLICNLVPPSDRIQQWKEIEEFYKVTDISSFINDLLNLIESKNPRWIKVHQARFYNVANCEKAQPSFIYNGDESLSFRGREYVDIELALRPGATSYVYHSNCYVFSIRHNETNKVNYGEIIHKVPLMGEIFHPVCISNQPLCLMNEYFRVLIDAYLEVSKREFKEMFKGYSRAAGTQKIFVTAFDNSSMITFVPSRQESVNLMRVAIEKCQKLLPFTPVSVVVPHKTLNCAVEIQLYGTNKMASRIHLFNESEKHMSYSNVYNPYRMQHHMDRQLPVASQDSDIPLSLEKDSIDYLVAQIDELKKFDNKIRICVTGQNYIVNIESKQQKNLKLKNRSEPTAIKSSQYVFNDNSTSNFVFILAGRDAFGKEFQFQKYMLQWMSISDHECDSSSIDRNDTPKLFESNQCIKIKLYKYRCFLMDDYTTVDSTSVSLVRPTHHDYDRGKDGQISDLLCRYKSEFTLGSESKKVIPRKLFNIRPGFDLSLVLNNLRSLTNYTESKNKLDDLIVQANALHERRQNLIDMKEKILESIDIQTDQKAMIKAKKEQKEIDSEYFSISIKIEEIEEKIETAQLLFNRASKFKNCKIINDDKICFDVPLETNLDEIKEILTDTIGEAAENPYLEKIPIYRANISRLKMYLIRKEEFIEMINEICGKFGGFIERIDQYVSTNSDLELGHIDVLLFSNIISYKFYEEVNRSLSQYMGYELKIPQYIIPNIYLRNQYFIDALLALFENNRIDIQKYGGKLIGGTDDINNALRLLQDEEVRQKLPFHTRRIPGGTTVATVFNDIRMRKNRLKCSNWVIDTRERTVLIPNDCNPDFENQIFEKYRREAIQGVSDEVDGVRQILGDEIFFCGEDARLSSNQIFVYFKDGRVLARNFCLTCVEDILIYNTNENGIIYDTGRREIIFDRLIENMGAIKPLDLVPCQEDGLEIWPVIPFGQLMNALIKEDKISMTVRAWFSAIVLHAIHTSPKISYCPLHPGVVYRREKLVDSHCSVPGCKMTLCSYCNKWHLPGRCEGPHLPHGFRICPACKKTIEKIEACNHITCVCGKHFCYYCGAGPFDDTTTCHNHLSKEHGGFYVDPPDYLKFCKRVNVGQEELEQFYQKYPQFR